MSEDRCFCRGTVILGYLKFIRKTWGEEGMEKCCGDLRIIHKNIKEGEWYDLQVSEQILEWIAGQKGDDAVVKAGIHTIKDQGIFSYIVRFANVKNIIRRAPESYNDVFKCGKMQVAELEERRALIKMKDTARSEYSCLAWKGAFMGALELTKTKGTVAEKQCQRDGHSHCEFLMEWE